jgi:hypothetical protein
MYNRIAELEPVYLNSVVAINVDKEGASGSPKLAGTGFLIVELIKEDNGKIVKGEDGLPLFNVFLVTNKHVITPLSFACRSKSKRDFEPIIVRFRSKQDGQTIEYRLPLYNNGKTGRRRLWIDHPEGDIDISIIRLNADQLKEDGWQFRDFPRINSAETNFMTIEQMRKEKVMEGNSVYTVGYPIDLVNSGWTDVTISRGYITKIRGVLERRDISFVIDASVAPGNSGSPVIRKHYEVFDLEKEAAIIRGSIIGIVSKGFFVNSETQEGDVIDKWNSTWVRVFPVDYILQTIEDCNKKGVFATLERRA